MDRTDQTQAQPSPATQAWTDDDSKPVIPKIPPPRHERSHGAAGRLTRRPTHAHHNNAWAAA